MMLMTWHDGDGLNDDDDDMATTISTMTMMTWHATKAMMKPVATINHDSKIDWLELNPRASHLLYRDKKRQLHLFNIVTQERVSLLNYCSYVQWVPDSDVIVAQVKE
ncbi:hypothetical protein CBR_g40614 [Chara braunii]|uniref:Anaphase-promoting complex subunit 4 WD40 domain-containing protein n=1 Tax=Chara braunii TaxID=69332 RepID=A0A388LU63_CHABU|nr:hypothetical protein CBR_g40614 [Chara braunii]|eukprot:GBG85805.1 hypothetical protein CBR_g40614 [Chara braunii]